MRMNSMLMAVTATLLLGYAANAQAEELDLDFKLVNSTGYTIKEVYISPTAKKDWGENIMKGKLKDGQTLDVTFHPKTKAARWDLRIVWADDGEAVEWTGYKLTEIEKITLKYDEKSEETSATTE